VNRCLGVIIQLSEQEQEELYEIGVTIGKIVSLRHYQLLNSNNQLSLMCFNEKVMFDIWLFFNF